MAVSDGFRDEAAVDGAFLNAARLIASSLLFGKRPFKQTLEIVATMPSNK